MSSTITTESLENKLKQIISNIKSLPTPPIVFEQIQKTIGDPDTSVGEVANILSEDPAMSVKVLKLTNSAFYGLSREIDSVKHAVMIIGLEAVKNLVLSASVLSMFKSNPENRVFHENFWRHSLYTALISRMIANDYRGGKTFNPDPAFSVGLIHDIGKMVICTFLIKEHKEIQAYLEQHSNASDIEAEIAILGYSHAQLGRQLAITWKLPDRMADSIGYHHSVDLDNNSDNFAHLCALANYIAHYATPDDRQNMERYKLPDSTRDFFEVDDEYLSKMMTRLVEEYSKAETFMAIAGQK